MINSSRIVKKTGYSRVGGGGGLSVCNSVENNGEFLRTISDMGPDPHQI
jgi:hypothetical protein